MSDFLEEQTCDTIIW